MGDGAEKIRPVFITLDPDRDTPEVLRDFVRHFHPRTVGLTGTQAQIDAATRAYDVEYLFVAAPGVPGGYTISHGGDLHLVGPDGRGIAVLDHQLGVAGLAAELRSYVKPDAGAPSS
jgi:protein SCO1/2